MEPGAQTVPCRTLRDVFAGVSAGALDSAVVPVENSLAGSIGDTYDLLLQHALQVTGETIISVDHLLLAPPETSLDQVKRAISHPQALSQCQEYLQSRGIDPVPHYDTAGAAKDLSMSREPNTAAIASERAGQIYALNELARSIQSTRDNFTRFLRIEKGARPKAERNKSMLAVTLPHHPGSLFLALSSFACRDINLTRIESRPVRRGPWEYVFYLEFEGHISDWQVKSALDEIKCKSSMFRILGSYPLEQNGSDD